MSEAAPKKTCSRSGCIKKLRQQLATYQIQKAAQEIVLTPSRLDLCWPTHVPCRVVAEAGQGWPRLVENGTSLHELKLVFKRDFAEAQAPPVLWPRQAGEEKGLRSLAVLELHCAPQWFPIRGPSVRSLALIDCGDQELNGTTVRSIGSIDLSVYTELKELRLIRTAAQIILPPLCRLTRLAITLGKCNGPRQSGGTLGCIIRCYYTFKLKIMSLCPDVPLSGLSLLDNAKLVVQDLSGHFVTHWLLMSTCRCLPLYMMVDNH
eukprot:g60567.t1